MMDDEDEFVLAVGDRVLIGFSLDELHPVPKTPS
jgi:hypothetical protein